MEAVGGQEEPLNRRADLFDVERLAQDGRPDGRQKLGRLRTHRTAGHEHDPARLIRSEEHTSELQSRSDLVCRLLLEKKNRLISTHFTHYHILKPTAPRQRLLS